MIIFVKIAVIATVIALATTGIIVGVIVGVVPTTEENACEKLRAPSGLRVGPVENFLAVSWAEADDDCGDKYRVVVKFEADAPVEITEEVTEPFFFFEHTIFCGEVAISVTRIAEDLTESATASLNYIRRVNSEFGTVTDLTISLEGEDKVLVEWVGPTGFDKCDITYDVTVKGETQTVSGTQHEVTLQNLVYCDPITVSVLPIIGDIDGIPKEKDIKLKISDGFPAVRNLREKSQDDDYVVMEWDPPIRYDKCLIDYDVTINGQVLTPEGTTVKVPLSYLVHCVPKQLQVVPEIDGKQGTPALYGIKLQVTEGFDSVDNLREKSRDNDNVEMEWDPPIGYEECPIDYKVTFNGGVLTPEGTTVNVPLSDMVHCVPKQLQVVPEIDGKQGTPAPYGIKLQVTEGFDPVDNLREKNRDNDNVEMEWDPPIGYEECPIDYKVTFNGGVLTPEGTTVNVPLSDMVHCVPKQLQVVPEIDGKQGTPEPYDIKLQVTEGFDPVDNLREKSRDNDKVEMVWNPPIGYEECPIDYKVTFNGGVLTPEGTTVNVPLSDMVHCVPKQLQVVPEIDGKQGTPEPYDIKLQVTEGFDPVDNLREKSRDNDNVEMEWDPPIGYEECPIDYKVTFNGGVLTPEGTTVNVPLSDMVHCVPKQLQVVPEIDGKQGTPEPYDIKLQVTEGFDPVDNLREKSRDNDNVEMEWDPPIGYEECPIDYKVTFNGGVLTPEGTTVNVPLSDMVHCVPKQLQVVPEIDGKQGTPEPYDIKLQVTEGFDPVDNLREKSRDNDKVEMVWNPPIGYEECPIDYKVTFNGGVLTPEGTTVNVPLSDMVHCVPKQLQVVPEIDGKQGTPEPYDIKLQVTEGFDPVDNLREKSRDNDNVEMEWDPPIGYEECPIDYKVTFNGGVLTPEGTTVNVPLSDMVHCVPKQLQVVPEIDGKQGTPEPYDIKLQVTEGFDPVDNLREKSRDNDNVEMEWDPPIGYEECPIDYKVTFNGGVLTPEGTTVNVPLSDMVHCVPKQLQVVPEIDGKQGTPEPYDIKLQVTEGFDPVDNLREKSRDNDNVEMEWDPPIGYEECPIDYKVTFNGGVLTPEGTTVNVPLSDMVHCVPKQLQVVPEIDGKQGTPEPYDIKLQVTEGFDPVDNLREKSGDNDNVEMEWNPPIGYEECLIDYEVTVNGQVLTPEGTTVEVPLIGSNPCESRTISVIPVIESLRGQVNTEPIMFRPVRNLRKDLSQSEENLLVEWDPVVGYEPCEVLYKVTAEGFPGGTVDVESIEIPWDDLKYCAIISVAVVIDGEEGIAESISADKNPTNIGQVESLFTDIAEQEFLATWDAPSGLELCPLEYDVELMQDSTSITSATIEEPTWTHDITIVCPGLDIEFTITPKHGTIKGTQASATEVCPPQNIFLN